MNNKFFYYYLLLSLIFLFIIIKIQNLIIHCNEIFRKKKY